MVTGRMTWDKLFKVAEINKIHITVDYCSSGYRVELGFNQSASATQQYKISAMTQETVLKQAFDFIYNFGPRIKKNQKIVDL